MLTLKCFFCILSQIEDVRNPYFCQTSRLCRKKGPHFVNWRPQQGFMDNFLYLLCPKINFRWYLGVLGLGIFLSHNALV